MSENDAQAMIDQADQMAEMTRRQARWYPVWLVVFSLFTVGLVASIPFWHGGWAVLAVLALAGFVSAMQYWTSRAPVHARGGRSLMRWAISWLALYLLISVVIGPRWLDHDAGLWALAGVIVAVPPLAEATASWRRLR